MKLHAARTPGRDFLLLEIIRGLDERLALVVRQRVDVLRARRRDRVLVVLLGADGELHARAVLLPEGRDRARLVEAGRLRVRIVEDLGRAQRRERAEQRRDRALVELAEPRRRRRLEALVVDALEDELVLVLHELDLRDLLRLELE